MLTNREGAVRKAVLDLALDSRSGDLSHETVAAKAEVDPGDLRRTLPTLEALIAFTVRPLSETVDDLVRRLPIHQTPTPAQQREVLTALLTASVKFHREQALLIRVLTSDNSTLTGRADQFAYQAGVRLLGANYDTNPDLMTRVYFVTEMIALSVATHRHDLASERTRELLLDSLVAVLNPSGQLLGGQAPRRRWADDPTSADPTSDGPTGDDQPTNTTS